MGWLRCHPSTLCFAQNKENKPPRHFMFQPSRARERPLRSMLCGANRGEWLLNALRMCHLASYVTLALPGDCTRRRGYSPLWVALGASVPCSALGPAHSCSPKAAQSLFPQEMAQTIRACRSESSTPPASNLVCEANFGPSFGGPTRLLFLRSFLILPSFHVGGRLLCVRGVSCILDTGAYVKVTRTCVSPLRSLRIGYMEIEP